MKQYRQFAAGLLAGMMMMYGAPALASSVQSFVLTQAKYPIMVNGSTYVSDALPVLNYQGNTYIPMRAVGDVLGAEVHWNEAMKRAEIRYGDGEAQQNKAFRGIKVSGANGKYTVTGEARVFEAVMQYAVSDGHNYLIEETISVGEGAPAWSPFTVQVNISDDRLPVNGTLTLELFEYSAKDGSVTNLLVVPLEQFQ